MEAITGVRVSGLFDCIVGTSTGGILALGLTKPGPGSREAQYTAEQLLGLYRDEGGQIFKPGFWRAALPIRKAPYPAAGLEKVLDRYFGDTALSEAVTDVAVTAYNIEQRRTYTFSSSKAAASNPEGVRIWDYFMRDMARATSAAPTFFPPACIYPIARQDSAADRHVLVDGGVFDNNPAITGLVEGIRASKQTEDWPTFLVFSLGTGSLTKRYLLEDARRWGLVGWGRRILDIVFDGVSEHTDKQLQRLFGGRSPGRVPLSVELRLGEAAG